LAVFLTLTRKFSNNNDPDKSQESEGQQPWLSCFVLPRPSIKLGGYSYDKSLSHETSLNHYFGEMLATEKEHLLSQPRIGMGSNEIGRADLSFLMKEIENPLLIQRHFKRTTERKLRGCEYTLQTNMAL